MTKFYYGPYRRIVYNCDVCGKPSWSEVAKVYSDEALTHQTGDHSKQRRAGYQKLCQECFEGPSRLLKTLRKHGYNAYYDDWSCELKGTYSGVIIWTEPRRAAQ